MSAIKNEIADLFLFHPEYKQALLAEINTLKGVVLSADAKDYNEAINLMEVRKNALISRIINA